VPALRGLAPNIPTNEYWIYNPQAAFLNFVTSLETNPMAVFEAILGRASP